MNPRGLTLFTESAEFDGAALDVLLGQGGIGVGAVANGDEAAVVRVAA